MISFVRHGETSANVAGELVGRGRDPGLTERGRGQAEQLAAALGARRAPRRIISSPMARARETAAVLAVGGGLSVELDERVAEIDYGEWEGLGVAQLATAEGRRWRADPEFSPPGGESLRSVQTRVAAFCAEMTDAGDGAGDGDIVVVSHVSPIKAAVVWALGVDERAVWRMFLANASITTVGARPDGQVFLAAFNETAHLR